jgi:hypothetical protein
MSSRQTAVFHLLILYIKEFKRSYIKRLSRSMKCKTGFKTADFVRWLGVIRFKNGAYTLVREYFESDYNTAIGQNMRF